MKKEITSIEEWHEYLLGILVEFDRVCKENGIHYSIAAGTMLGAVRHGGFIPWDDDADVIMLREEYEKLLNVQHAFSDRYRLMALETDKNFRSPLAKVVDVYTELTQTNHRSEEKLGIYLDVFVYDFVPENKLLHTYAVIRNKFYLKLWGLATYPVKTGIKAEKLLRCFAADHKWDRFASEKLNRYAKKQKKSSLVGNLLYRGPGPKSMYTFKLEEFKYKRISFSGHLLETICDTDSALTQLYGDYMKLPPIEKQVSGHVCKSYYVGPNT